MGNFLRKYFIVILIVALLAAAAVYFLRDGGAPGQTPETEARELAEKVGKIMLLPENELPTVATVSDPAALEGQAFFAQAQVGDKVLIYTGRRIAILYRPSIGKIINIAPVNIGGQSNAPATQ